MWSHLSRQILSSEDHTTFLIITHGKLVVRYSLLLHPHARHGYVWCGSLLCSISAVTCLCVGYDVQSWETIIALVEESKWAGAWMKPTCSFVLCVVDDCRTTLCSNLKWLRKDHNCLLSSINATASSALQSAKVTKGNNPKCDSNTNLFRVFYNRCGRQLVDLLFDVSCMSFWNEGEIRPVTRTTAFCYIHCNPSSIPSSFFSACFFFSRTFLIMVVLELQM